MSFTPSLMRRTHKRDFDRQNLRSIPHRQSQGGGGIKVDNSFTSVENEVSVVEFGAIFCCWIVDPYFREIPHPAHQRSLWYSTGQEYKGPGD
jgi:hypothetical protein